MAAKNVLKILGGKNFGNKNFTVVGGGVQNGDSMLYSPCKALKIVKLKHGAVIKLGPITKTRCFTSETIISLSSTNYPKSPIQCKTFGKFHILFLIPNTNKKKHLKRYQIYREEIDKHIEMYIIQQ